MCDSELAPEEVVLPLLLAGVFVSFVCNFTPISSKNQPLKDAWICLRTFPALQPHKPWDP